MVIEGYLAHEKHHLPRTLQWHYSWGRMMVLEGAAFSYEQGNPVAGARTPTFVHAGLCELVLVQLPAFLHT